jgi:hypothetical protein
MRPKFLTWCRLRLRQCHSTIDELFKGPWGIVESRRKDIQAGPFGSFDRIYEEEVSSNFVPIQKVAALLDCHEATARDWLRQCDARYIKRTLAHLYYTVDVEISKTKRAEREADRKASRRPTKQRNAT